MISFNFLFFYVYFHVSYFSYFVLLQVKKLLGVTGLKASQKLGLLQSLLKTVHRWEDLKVGAGMITAVILPFTTIILFANFVSMLILEIRLSNMNMNNWDKNHCCFIWRLYFFSCIWSIFFFFFFWYMWIIFVFYIGF